MKVVPTAESPTEEEKRKASEYTDLLREILGSKKSADDYATRWRVGKRQAE